jgi:CRP-like cAMP-binding protein
MGYVLYALTSAAGASREISQRGLPAPDGGRHVRGTWRWPPASLLGSLDAESRERLLEPGTMREYPADRRLISQGDTSTFAVVLLDGVVKVTGVSSAGREALLAIRAGGDIVGELAAIDGRPRSCTITDWVTASASGL